MSILGNIYVGKVRNIVKNIQAAFVEIEDGILCYLPLEDIKSPIYTKPKKQERLVEGDELLVQVSREAVKTKAPSVTTNLSLTGKYLVLTTGNRKIGFSSKLKTEEKELLKELVQNWELPDAGLILRTNAADAGQKELDREYAKLLGQYRFLTEQAVYRSVHSCVLAARPHYLSSILGSRSESLREILTDDACLFRQIKSFLEEEMPEDTEKLRLYEDRQLPLKALYRMEKGLSDALSSRVWLKSGAYLIIQPTEALTVIDVNTGKYTAGKNKQETIRKINQEAAREIAVQLRLRNLSGIILIDFVDMNTPDEKQHLLELMQAQLRRDPMKAAAVDMTALGLMELTRKKEKKTLSEQAKECGI
ncbi:MAG: ribonuclease E/G [Clostridiales bacterium]|nr:ribonuclease E/G [Clostridiales bacterium]